MFREAGFEPRQRLGRRLQQGLADVTNLTELRFESRRIPIRLFPENPELFRNSVEIFGDDFRFRRLLRNDVVDVDQLLVGVGQFLPRFDVDRRNFVAERRQARDDLVEAGLVDEVVAGRDLGRDAGGVDVLL